MPIDPPSSPLPPLSNAPVANPVSPLPVYVPSVSEPQTSLPTFVPAASAPQTALPVPPALPSNGVPLEDRILALEQALGLGAAVQTVSTTDPRLSDAREWTAQTISQAEAESGTATTRRAFTAQRVRQAIVAWWNTFSAGFRNFVSNPTSDNFALWLTNANGTGGGFVRADGATLNAPTIVGPANLTNQDAATGSRLLNRDLADARYGGQVIVVRKSVNTARNSTTTRTADPELAIALTPGTYIVELAVQYFCASGIPGINTELRYTGVASQYNYQLVRGGSQTAGTTASYPDQFSTAGASTFFGLDQANQNGWCRIIGSFIVGTNGSLQLEWAQRTSSADTTTVGVGSFLKVQRIA